MLLEYYLKESDRNMTIENLYNIFQKKDWEKLKTDKGVPEYVRLSVRENLY